MRKKVLILGDIHFPFEDEEALDQVVRYAGVFQPDLVIQMGDLYDFFAFSKYPRSLNLLTPEHELEMGERKARAMWAGIARRCPNAKKVQLTGNHDSRPLKRALEHLGVAETFVSREVRRMMGFPGVELIFNEKEEYVYDGVLYQHGYRKFGDHARFNQMNTAAGHLHRGGVVWYTNLDGAYFELNAGWLGDKRCPVFDYRSQKRISETTIGFGQIDELGPRFVSLE